MIFDKKRGFFWAALLGGAFVLRAIGVTFGLYYPDEHLIVNHALAFGTGDLNPHMFYFPTFFPYLVFFVYVLFYVVGSVAGVFQGKEEFLAAFLRNPHAFYVLARFVSVLFGAATPAVVYFLGKEYKNARTGIAAALFLAVNFLHVRDSHFATMDVTLAFFVTLSFAFLLRYLSHGRPRDGRLSALTAGVAAAVKYNAFALGFPIALAYGWMLFLPSLRGEKAARRGAAFLREGIVSAALLVFGFFLFSPFVILDWKIAFGFIRELYEINRGFDVHWARHAVTLFYALDWPLFVAALLGIGLIRGKRGVTALFFFALYYAMITKAGQPFERYVLVFVPFCAVWAGAFLDAVSSRFFRGNQNAFWILAGLLILLLLPKTLYSDFLFLRKDTRDLAQEWIEDHIPPGTAIVLDDSGQCPRLTPSSDQIRERRDRLDSADPRYPAKRKRLEALLSLKSYPSPNYRLWHLLEKPDQTGVGTLFHSMPYSWDAIRQSGGAYLVTNEASMRVHPEFYEAAKGDLELIFLADPRRDTSRPMSPKGWTYLPIDHSLWDRSRPGPLLYVFRLKFS